ncbi:IclR family transcriptional regulator [Falsiroseomonas selenitidurans]|uniref:IclR family transcriptional regulator n=1 Tax=Falsiroseomonas selenitidurans TaxID=2716335 RepID=A0ABX1E1G8_9PROT|nr:IclR family transcriptional regulator [Falsiroseomonas selenitidurans]NKC29592.1 IclR family transcriptional regulator [Falsiroseomonas selenitidurans]
MDTSTDLTDNRIPAVDRALHLLDLLCAEGPPLGIREMSARLGIPRSTVYRILNSFEAHGVVLRQAEGGFVPGPRLLAYARAVPPALDLPTLAAPVLADLARVARLTAKLSVLDAGAALVVAVAPGPGAYSITTHVGRRFPLHAGAASKILAAHMPAAARAALLEGPLPRATPATVTDPARLAAILDAARQDGLAHDHAEYTAGVHAMAAPVPGPDGACAAAISVTYLPNEPPARLAAVEAALRQAAGRLARLLGGAPPPKGG